MGVSERKETFVREKMDGVKFSFEGERGIFVSDVGVAYYVCI